MPSSPTTTRKGTDAIAAVMFLASLFIFGSNGIVADGVALTSSQIVFFRMPQHASCCSFTRHTNMPA